MLRFALEKWDDALPEMERIFPVHWEEIAVNKEKVKLAMNHEFYRAVEKAGALVLITARDKGHLVGYWSLFVNPHPHYKNDLFAISDFFYMAKPYRDAKNGIDLFRFSEKVLKDRGVKVMAATTKLHADRGKFFEYLGWHPSERLYTKYIGD